MVSRRSFLIQGAAGLAALAVVPATLAPLGPGDRAELMRLIEDGWVTDRTFIIGEPLPIDIEGGPLIVSRCLFLWQERPSAFVNIMSARKIAFSRCIFTTVASHKDPNSWLHGLGDAFRSGPAVPPGEYELTLHTCAWDYTTEAERLCWGGVYLPYDSSKGAI